MPIPFPVDVVTRAFARAGGRCECTRFACGHRGQCPEKLQPWGRGYEGPGGWETHHKDRNGPATLDNCEILCRRCIKATR